MTATGEVVQLRGGGRVRTFLGAQHQFTGTNLRLHFQRILDTTPSEYRRTFTQGE